MRYPVRGWLLSLRQWGAVQRCFDPGLDVPRTRDRQPGGGPRHRVPLPGGCQWAGSAAAAAEDQACFIKLRRFWGKLIFNNVT